MSDRNHRERGLGLDRGADADFRGRIKRQTNFRTLTAGLDRTGRLKTLL
jgi:hypothetical protein